MSKIYYIFSASWEHVLDYSDSALMEMFIAESYGAKTSKNNGFAVGKKYLNLHVKTWKADIRDGLLSEKELYEDPKFPHYWLNSVLKK